jgi:hypothetical protein
MVHPGHIVGSLWEKAGKKVLSQKGNKDIINE